ncbi:dihydroxyacetone kinase phosphoryl donor subunit DhaM [Romboutsia sp.]|uniref:dihydroxyacetone kinase phosphoryl donor subunit DhaM n=1 Tax=Romboutsia sp. TaxID=1965302 RepID=UPI003F330B91
MIGLVIVSHSEDVAKGVKNIVTQMAGDIKIATAGGTDDNRIGTDYTKITNAINEVYSSDGVIVLFDLGSAYMNTEMAVDFLDDEMKENIHIVDASLVEGALVAGVDISIGRNIKEILNSLKPLKLNKF